MRVHVSYRMAGKDNYYLFCEENTEIKLTYLEFQNIIYSFNYSFWDYLMETGNKGKLPWGIGDFAVSKRRPRRVKTNNKGKEVIGLPIDWKKTKEMGKIIYHMNYHTDGFKFRIKWFRKSARFKMADVWNFKPSRVASRMIKHFITQGYQHKYYEWDATK